MEKYFNRGTFQTLQNRIPVATDLLNMVMIVFPLVGGLIMFVGKKKNYHKHYPVLN